MGMRAREFRAVESIHDFADELTGAIRRQQLVEDQVGMLRVAVLLAGGVTLQTGDGGPPPRNAPTFERIMGRPPVPYVDPPPKTAAELEREAEAAARLAQAKLQIAEANLRAYRPDLIAESEEPTPSPAE